MATTATVIPVEEYLAARYDGPAPEYVDGQLVERSVPTWEHSNTQLRAGYIVQLRCPRLRCGTELHVQVRPNQYRILDVAVYLDHSPSGIPDIPPLVDLELLSPNDAMSEIVDRFEELRAWGVQHLWLIDPIHRRLYKLGDRSLLPVPAFEIPELQLRLTPQDLFD